MAFTVTATPGGASFFRGVDLLVRVLTNAAETGGASNGARNTANAAAQGTLTPNTSSSWVGFALTADGVTTQPAAATSNTYDYSPGGHTDTWVARHGHYTGTVTASTPLTYGASASQGGGQDHENWCAFEVPASGGSITIDGSSPAGVQTDTGTSVATGSFTPPVGSVLVAMVAAGGTGSGGGVTCAMSDTSGLGLVWTQRVTSSSSDNFQPTFIFTATVPAAAPLTPAGREPLNWLEPLSSAFGPNLPFGIGGFSIDPGPAATVNAQVATVGVQAIVPAGFRPYVYALGGSGYNSYFTDINGIPRMVLSEQAWALPWNAGRWNGGNWQSDFTTYFSSRSAQGYNAWYGVVWGQSHIDSTALSGGRSWDGVYPLNIDGTPGAIVTGSETVTLNDTFWTRIDAFISTAMTYGHSVFMNLSMSYDISVAGSIWQNATNTQGTAFGAAVAARYPQANWPNLHWFFGDDDDGPNDSFYQAILDGIQGTGDTRPLISIEQFTNTNCHIAFSSGGAFSGSFGAPNATYNFVYSYDATYFGVESSYSEGGTFTHIPPAYLDGVYYGDTGSGTNTDRVMRNFAWWALSSGARGFTATSGPSDLGGGGLWTWQSDAVGRLAGDPNGDGTWTTSRAGAVKAYITSLTDWHKLIPDTGNVFITAGRGTRGTCDSAGGVFNFRNSNDYVAGSITSLGTLAVIYCKAAMSITIDQSKMGAGYTATWVDPASLATQGTATGSTYASAGLGNNSAGDPDWVLVLQGPPTASAMAGAATSSVVAPNAQAAVSANAGAAAISAVAPAAGHSAAATAGVPASSAVASAGQAAITVTAGVAAVTAAAVQPAVSTSGGTNAPAGAAAVSAGANPPQSAGVSDFRLMDGASGRPGNGPAVSAYSGNFIAGVLWKVTTDNLWMTGYWHWVPTGGDTTSRKFALWQLTAGLSVGQVLVPEGTVTSGTLTANSWNFVALPAPVELSKTVPYVACYGYVAANGFPDTQNQFGSGQPYAAGITSGPLFAYSDQGASAPEPFTSNYSQMVFSTAGSDPSVTFPSTADVHSNFWIDVQVTATQPAGAHYRLWPSQPYAVNYVDDTADNFTLGCEFTLAKTQTLNKIWFYSGAGYTQLPTRCAIWDTSGQTIVSGTDQTSPSWSGAAGSGWVSVSYSGVSLTAGDYKVTVLNGAGSPSIWNPTTNSYWGILGPGQAGIVSGPLFAPQTQAATPPGQDTYNLGATFTYPLTFAGGADGANYWVDLEVSDPAGTAAAGVAAVTAAAPAATAAETAAAGVAAVSSPAPAATTAVTVNAGVAVISAVAPGASAATSGNTNAAAGVATVSAAAPAPAPAATVKAGAATAQAATSAPVAAPAATPPAATVLAAAPPAALQAAATAQAAQVLAAAVDVPPPFTVGTLTATDAPGGAGGVLTASDTRTGGPGG